MNLEQFIQSTLAEIIAGVKGAQVETRLSGKHHTESDLINPRIMYGADAAPKGKYFARQDRNLVHFVSFDVAVTSEQSAEAKGGFSIRVAGIGANAGAGGSERDTVVSRIKFEVPIALPQSSDSEPTQ